MATEDLSALFQDACNLIGQAQLHEDERTIDVVDVTRRLSKALAIKAGVPSGVGSGKSRADSDFTQGGDDVAK